MSIKVGDTAPDFTLTSNTGEKVTLSSFFSGDPLQRKNVVLFFYPKDNTPGCTAEVCDFRDTHARFLASGAEVIGVSSDSVESHEKFVAKHSLPMKLLSDPGGVVRARYGVKPTFGIWPGRVTYVIDRDAKVRYMFDSAFRATQHVAKALEIVKGLETETSLGA